VEDLEDGCEEVLVRELVSLHGHPRAQEIEWVGGSLCEDPCRRTAEEQTDLSRYGVAVSSMGETLDVQ
jgi:hypothetical protein